MNLPDPCEKCRPFGGNFVETPGGMKRCDCPRGRALAAPLKVVNPDIFEPVISGEYAMICAEIVAGIPFFPAGSATIGNVANEIAAICETEKQARWLAVRMTRLYEKWPGVIEMRRVFCATHQPFDGVRDVGTSEVYPNGFPSERSPDPDPPQLLGGREPQPISGSPTIAATVRDLAVKTDLNRYPKPARVRDFPVRQLIDAERITHEKVREAEEEYRTAKAREELGLAVETKTTGKDPKNAEGSRSAEGV